MPLKWRRCTFLCYLSTASSEARYEFRYDGHNLYTLIKLSSNLFFSKQNFRGIKFKG